MPLTEQVVLGGAGILPRKGLAAVVQLLCRLFSVTLLSVTCEPRTQMFCTFMLSPLLKIAAGLPVEATSISQFGALMLKLELTSRDCVPVGSRTRMQTALGVVVVVVVVVVTGVCVVTLVVSGLAVDETLKVIFRKPMKLITLVGMVAVIDPVYEPSALVTKLGVPETLKAADVPLARKFEAFADPALAAVSTALSMASCSKAMAEFAAAEIDGHPDHRHHRNEREREIDRDGPAPLTQETPPRTVKKFSKRLAHFRSPLPLPDRFVAPTG